MGHYYQRNNTPPHSSPDEHYRISLEESPGSLSSTSSLTSEHHDDSNTFHPMTGLYPQNSLQLDLNPHYESEEAIDTVVPPTHDPHQDLHKIRVHTHDVIPQPPTPRSVRFRDRVRITSGIRYHRDVASSDAGAGDDLRDFSQSRSSSVSDTSSISVPLRSPASDTIHTRMSPAPRRSLGLSAAINSSAANTWLINQHQRSPASRGRRKHQLNGDMIESPNPNAVDPTERTPMLGGKSHTRRPMIATPIMIPTYVEPDDDDGESVDEQQTEEDVIFGTFPARLCNPRWWSWKSSSFRCCSSADSHV